MRLLSLGCLVTCGRALMLSPGLPQSSKAGSALHTLSMVEAPFLEGCTYTDRTSQTDKEKIVVLGAGWAAVKFLINVDTSRYDVTVISPRNFFLFTPFLPSCVVGTVEPRSIVEPIRKLLQYESRPITRKIKDKIAGITEENFEPARFLEAACTKIDVESNSVFCQDISGVSGACETFSVDYDKLVVAVGATSNTFNTPGVKEHAVFLKELNDAASIRDRLVDAFESAALQDNDEDKLDLLTFTVVGAGPTGVEFAAELDDHIREDLSKLYPEEAKIAKVLLVSSSDDLLSTYDKKVSDFTKLVLDQSRVEVIAGVRVVEVGEKELTLMDKKTKETYKVPTALTLWSTGVKPFPVVEDLIASIPEQTKKTGIVVDKGLKALGTDNVYAAGDCATLYTGDTMLNELGNLFSKADADGSGTLDKDETLSLFSQVSGKFPQAETYKAKIESENYFEEIDVDGSGELDLDEFKTMLLEVDGTMRNLPPTAQVAGQQGGFLAARLNGETLSDFKYFHKGSMAYIGQDKAAAQVSMLKSLLPTQLQGLPLIGDDIVLTGTLAEIVWKFLYLDMQISNRNKLQVGFDWLKTGAFGRDTSRIA